MNKSNPDYGASAADLSNPPEVKEKLEHRIGIQKTIADLENLLQSYPEWQQLQDTKKGLAELDKDLYTLIDKFGGYQNQEKGIYALKQIRESLSYKPELVRQYAPSKVASFVLVESVDGKAMEAMIKTGQIKPEIAKQCGEVKLTYAYIIRS